jgi:hypothetical protein
MSAEYDVGERQVILCSARIHAFDLICATRSISRHSRAARASRTFRSSIDPSHGTGDWLRGPSAGRGGGGRGRRDDRVASFAETAHSPTASVAEANNSPRPWSRCRAWRNGSRASGVAADRGTLLRRRPSLSHRASFRGRSQAGGPRGLAARRGSWTRCARSHGREEGRSLARRGRRRGRAAAPARPDRLRQLRHHDAASRGCPGRLPVRDSARGRCVALASPHGPHRGAADAHGCARHGPARRRGGRRAVARSGREAPLRVASRAHRERAGEVRNPLRRFAPGGGLW